MVTKNSLPKGVWDTYNGQIVKLRQQGLTLQLIGDKVGVTRERIRQILKQHYGSTKVPGFTTREKLANLIGCSKGMLAAREKEGLLNPLHNGGPYLYNRDEAEKAAILVAQAREREPDVERTCEVCGRKFYVRPYKINSSSPRRFCSRRCHGIWFGKYFGSKHRKYDRDRIWELYQEGKALGEIAQSVGVPYGTVNTILFRKRKQLGVALRPRVKRAEPITRRQPPPEEKECIGCGAIHTRRSLFCSTKCRDRIRALVKYYEGEHLGSSKKRKKVKVHCFICGAEVERIDTHHIHFCNRCLREYRRQVGERLKDRR